MNEFWINEYVDPKHIEDLVRWETKSVKQIINEIELWQTKASD